jgi:TetR/AcrR family transcriptional repressor of mexJK operon
MSEAVESARAGRPKSEQKADAILCAAAELFLRNGFQTTSMDAVAQRAGVSKQTVYSHFANKEELFKACIRAKVAGYGFEDTARVTTGDLRTALLTIARRFVDLLFDPEVIAMHRVVMAEAVSQPRIAALFYESGPQRTKAAVSVFLQEHVVRGRLRIGDDHLFYAAVQLLNMAIGMYQTELLLGLRQSVSDEELQPHLERVVEDFLRLYAIDS